MYEDNALETVEQTFEFVFQVLVVKFGDITPDF